MRVIVSCDALPMSIVSSVITWVLKRRYDQIQAFCRNPHETQQAIFQSIITQASTTEWGRKYGYADIKTIRTFKERVPVSTYEDIYPYIERMMLGEQNILWPTPIHWFSKSSGTTNARSKFIPVSQESLEQCHYKGGKDLICLYLQNREGTRVLHGKNLAIGGTYQHFDQNPEVRFGDVSAIIMKNLPSWAQWMRTPRIEVALMDKWEEKIEKIAEETLSVDVTSLSGVPTWMVVLLQRVMEIKGAKTLHEVWPNLEVFLHGAVSFTPYRELFKQMIPDPKMSYLETYNASEGFFGIQDDLSLTDEMLLMLDYGIYYEFAPMEEVGKLFPKTLGLDEVELNKNYALIISSNGGLWRYMIGDTIKFTNLNPFRVKVSGRTKHFINAFGEELIVENAEIGIAQACQVTHAIISNFTAAPVFMQTNGKGGHEWIIEFEKMPDDLAVFTQILDQKLREINSDYDAKRYQDIALQAPLIHVAPKGTFYEWLKRRGKLGGQHKVPRLSNSREYVEEIKAMFEEV